MGAAAGTIAIAGAGSIGCYVGGMLADAGRSVALLARPRVIDEIASAGLRVTSVDGLDRLVAAERLRMSDNPTLLADVSFVLMTVKSNDTVAVADQIARHAPPDVVVVSLQNGVGNAEVLQARLPGRRILAGMVPFNVLSLGAGHVHRATSGDIVIARDPTDVAARLSVPGMSMRPSDDIAAVQWGKLIVNLNNALNALSGLPLRDQLGQRAWRRLFADQMAEGIAAMRAAGIAPVSATPLPVWLTPHLLRLPDGLFKVLLGGTMKMDAQARSSMWEDLQRGRRTEIDYLQGVIVDLAQRHGRDAPLSRAVVALVKAAEAACKGSPELRPEQIVAG